MITEQQIQERLRGLPQEMFDAVTSDERVTEIQGVAVKYNLRIDKVEDLIQEVGFVMLGFKKSHEFVKSLSKKLEVDQETAESIAIDVDEQVFKKIRKSLQEVQYGEEFNGAHDMEQEEVGASPARDSLIKEVESHAQGENPLAAVSSSANYDPSLFASAPAVSSSATSKPAADPYREVPVGFETVAVSEPAPTPFESHRTEVNPSEIPQETIMNKIDPSESFKEVLAKKVDPVVKATANQDPYRESID